VNLGPVFSFHLQNSNGVFETELNGNPADVTNIALESFVADKMAGISIGSGLMYNLDSRKTVSTEIRFNGLFGNNEYLGKNQINLLLAYTF
jgi:hypothetical protein